MIVAHKEQQIDQQNEAFYGHTSQNALSACCNLCDCKIMTSKNTSNIIVN